MQRYRVLIVDDEPAAVQYLDGIVKAKCPGFLVAGTVENGIEALKWLEKESADVVVSDVMMPGMNGVELVMRLHAEYPEIISVIISGYQEFEYARGALKAGCEDYLLKPVDIREMQELMQKIQKKLDALYYERKNAMLHDLSVDRTNVDPEELKRLFPAKRYYAAIIRKNGMISRFNRHSNHEIFSTENEQMTVYGRDNMETLFLYPEELIVTDFKAVMEREFLKQRDEESFLTMVLQEVSFEITKMADVIKSLYQTLDKSIVIGMEQKLLVEWANQDVKDSEKAAAQLRRIRYFIDKKEVQELPVEMEKLIDIWEKEQMPQIRIENEVRHLFYEMKNNHILDEWNEYWLEDAFSEALSMAELGSNINEIIRQCTDKKLLEKKYDREMTFQEIVTYMKKHLRENLSVHTVCRKVGISQTTLSRLFRTYASMPYSNYLTNLRMEAAKNILAEHPDSFIKDVAEYVGFNDQFYFSRVFRSVTGKSPTEFAEEKGGGL